jgi:hypothetical protein
MNAKAHTKARKDDDQDQDLDQNGLVKTRPQDQDKPNDQVQTEYQDQYNETNAKINSTTRTSRHKIKADSTHLIRDQDITQDHGRPNTDRPDEQMKDEVYYYYNVSSSKLL